MNEKYNIPEIHSLDSMEGVSEIEKQENKNHNENDSGNPLEILDTNVLKYLDITPAELGPLKDKVLKIEDLLSGIEKENLISLDSFTIPSVQNLDKRTSDGRNQSTPFANDILLYLEDIQKNKPVELEKIRKYFEGKVLVDMGAGERPIGYWIACLLNAKGYIGVEPYNWQNLMEYLLKFKAENISNALGDVEPIPFNFVVEDAVTFLRRIPEGQVSLVSSGLADSIVGSSESYEKDLETEMLRVLAEGGACLLSNSIVPSSLYNQEHTVANTRGSQFEDRRGRERIYGPVTILRK